MKSGDEIGPYRVVRLLGQGGMGAVYEVEHRDLGVRYALKVFTCERSTNAFLRKRRVPGEIHVRSSRMARFLRPLGIQLPFKLVQHAKLPSLEDVLGLAIQTRNV